MVFKCLSMPDFAYRSIFFHLKVISNQHRTKILANPLRKYRTELSKLKQIMSMSIRKTKNEKLSACPKDCFGYAFRKSLLVFGNSKSFGERILIIDKCEQYSGNAGMLNSFSFAIISFLLEKEFQKHSYARQFSKWK